MSAETRRRTILAEVDLWLAKIAADIVPVDAELVDLTTQAWLIYGKGAFTDCCSYVAAKRADESQGSSSATILRNAAT